MLVFAMRIGESMMVGDNVEVFVLGVKGNQIKIGTKAPKEIAVHRKVVWNRLQAQKESAS
jgi:carbon storage regulator